MLIKLLYFESSSQEEVLKDETLCGKDVSINCIYLRAELCSWVQIRISGVPVNQPRRLLCSQSVWAAFRAALVFLLIVIVCGAV